MRRTFKMILALIAVSTFIYACVSGSLKPKDVCIDFADRDAASDSGDFAKKK